MGTEIAASARWDIVLEAEPLAGRSGHEDVPTGNELSRQVHEGAGTPAIASRVGVFEGFLMGLAESAQRAESGVAADAPVVQAREQAGIPCTWYEVPFESQALTRARYWERHWE